MFTFYKATVILSAVNQHHFVHQSHKLVKQLLTVTSYSPLSSSTNKYAHLQAIDSKSNIHIAGTQVSK